MSTIFDNYIAVTGDINYLQQFINTLLYQDAQGNANVDFDALLPIAYPFVELSDNPDDCQFRLIEDDSGVATFAIKFKTKNKIKTGFYRLLIKTYDNLSIFTFDPAQANQALANYIPQEKERMALMSKVYKMFFTDYQCPELRVEDFVLLARCLYEVDESLHDTLLHNSLEEDGLTLNRYALRAGANILLEMSF